MSEPLKWEFPGGKVEAEEEPRAALEREILEELGVRVRVGEWLGRGTSEKLCLDVFSAEIQSGEIALAEHRDHRWVGAEELNELDWAELDRPILESVRKRLL